MRGIRRSLSIVERAGPKEVPRYERIRRRFRRAMYEHAWDTRCRNLSVARILSSHLAKMPRDQRRVLDVGSGSQGVAVFLRDVEVVGTDLVAPKGEIAASRVHVGDITALPFDDRAFPVTSCVDVLEHFVDDEARASY